jgi:hypothetical protein
MDTAGAPPYSWTNWLRAGYPIWGREFKEGWTVTAPVGNSASSTATTSS